MNDARIIQHADPSARPDMAQFDTPDAANMPTAPRRHHMTGFDVLAMGAIAALAATVGVIAGHLILKAILHV